MGTHPLLQSTFDMQAAAVASTQRPMIEIAYELDEFHQLPMNVANAIRAYTQRLHSTKPVNQAVIDLIEEVYTGLMKLVPVAEEIGPRFRGVHAHDLARIETPRVNEADWDVTRNV